MPEEHVHCCPNAASPLSSASAEQRCLPEDCEFCAGWTAAMEWEQPEPDAEIAKAARELARFLISSNMDMGEGPRDFALTVSPKDGPPRGREVRDAACRNLIAAIRGDSWKESPDAE